MFVGRRYELNSLNEAFKSNKFEMSVIYGRRRIGKTRLIQEFCSDKRTIYYLATEQTDEAALSRFSKTVLKIIPAKSSRYLTTFTTWEHAFEYIAEIAKLERIVLVIDELPYLAASNTSFMSILQASIDRMFLDSKLFLILCGSSVSFMEDEVLGYENSIYERCTQQYKIEALPYYEALELFGHWDPIDAMYAYGVAGGIPMYLEKLAVHKDFRTGIINELLSTQGYLFQEPTNIMKHKMREPAVYNTILETIAKEETKQSNISSKSNINRNALDYYLKNLISIGIIEKILPFGSKNNRQTLYKFSDNLSKFWFKFIPDNLSLIEMRNSDYIFDEIILPKMELYFDFVFENICKQYLNKIKYQNDIPFINIGSWWGSDPNTKMPDEIDIVAETEETILFGECEWTNEPISKQVLDTLLRKSALIKHNKLSSYIFFSKAGFTLDANMSVELVDLEKILALVNVK